VEERGGHNESQTVANLPLTRVFTCWA